MSVAVIRRPAPPTACFTWPPGRALLSAEWRHLVMLNYEIDPAVLQPFVPAGTELDVYDGRTYASIVGFLFRRTRLLGLPAVFHANFEEVNLRFYIRRDAGGELRRGVTFLRELVPRRAVTLVANAVYGESYRTVPMSHDVTGEDPTFARPPRRLEYRWSFADRVHRIALATDGVAQPLVAGSHEEFIAEHYWGYTALGRGTAEYAVAHPAWRISSALQAELDADVAALYGPQFAEALHNQPASAFWVDGSAVRVYRGIRIR